MFDLPSRIIDATLAAAIPAAIFGSYLAVYALVLRDKVGLTLRWARRSASIADLYRYGATQIWKSTRNLIVFAIRLIPPAAVVLLSLALLVPTAMSDLQLIQGGSLVFWLVIIFAVRPFFANSIRDSFRRLKQNNLEAATELHELDGRPRILLLRSFKDDKIELSCKRSFDQMIFGLSPRWTTLEETLADVAYRYGPVGALQDPKVSNRPGAQGAIASQAAAREKPDGYTFLLASLGQLVVNKYTMKTLGYDPDKDFVPVALLGRAPYIVLVNPTLPVRSLADLAKFDRENPGKISLAYEGSSILAGSAYLKQIMGLSLELVPYNSPLQAIQDTIGGIAHVHVQGTAIGLSFATNGKLRAIAVTTDKRLPQLSDVPTVNESYPDFGSFEAWLMIVAPAGTPPDIIKRMSGEIARAGNSQELRDLFSKLGFFDNEDRTPETAAAYLKQQGEQFAKMAKAADLKPE